VSIGSVVEALMQFNFFFDDVESDGSDLPGLSLPSTRNLVALFLPAPSRLSILLS
jgi:hypothetical protein